MTNAPDYGLAMFNKGVPHDETLDFPDLCLDHISALAPCEYSSFVVMPVEQVPHLLSLDFDVNQLEEMLSLCPEETTQLVLNWVDSLRGPGTLELPEPIHLGLSTKLGQLETDSSGPYMPLVVQKVYEKVA